MVQDIRRSQKVYRGIHEKNWGVEMIAGRKKFVEEKIQRVISQEEVLSHYDLFL